MGFYVRGFPKDGEPFLGVPEVQAATFKEDYTVDGCQKVLDGLKDIKRRLNLRDGHEIDNRIKKLGEWTDKLRGGYHVKYAGKHSEHPSVFAYSDRLLLFGLVGLLVAEDLGLRHMSVPFTDPNSILYPRIIALIRQASDRTVRVFDLNELSKMGNQGNIRTLQEHAINFAYYIVSVILLFVVFLVF